MNNTLFKLKSKLSLIYEVPCRIKPLQISFVWEYILEMLGEITNDSPAKIETLASAIFVAIYVFMVII